MGGAIKSAASTISKPLGFALNPTMALGATSMGLGGMGGGNPNAPTVRGNQSPMEMLSNTGGAPLLANIAMGADVDDSLAGFLGIPKAELLDAMAGRNSILGTPEQAKATIQQITSIRNQLTSVQNDTNLKNKAVTDLVQHFPNYMASKVPEYAHLMDDQTKQMMDQALQQVGAKYAAGGQLSSGATAAAGARAGADIGMQRLQYGTNMAITDFNNQLSNASALQSFQQKMLGQTSLQGFNAVQNALVGNRQISMGNADLQNQQQLANQGSTNAMFGAMGQLGGTALGYSMFGPMGGAVGGQIGGTMGSAVSGNSGVNTSPRLNLPRVRGY